MKNIKFTVLPIIIFILVFIYYLSINITSNGFINNTILNNEVIVIVGDSRMELLERRRNEISIPYYVEFNAKSGADINWFIEKGIPNLYKILKNKKHKYKVIFNLGVNDLNDNINIKNRTYEYYKLYKNIKMNNKDTKFYYLTVNPIDDNNINIKWKKNIRTNKKIEKFNKYMKSYMEKTNITYCDSYSNIEFNLPDALHFDKETDILILDYILNKCIIK